MSFEAFTSSHSSKDGAGFLETARLIAGENPPQWLAAHLQRWSSSVFLDGNVHAKQPGKAEVRARLQRLTEAVGLVQREIHDPKVVPVLLAEEFGPLPDGAGLDAVLREIQRRADAASSQLGLLGTGLDIRLEDLSDALSLTVREIENPELSAFLKSEQTGGATTTQLGALLKDIERQAGAAFLSPYLANESGQTQAGRGRALPPMASSARAFCAAVILEAWAHFHDGEYPVASNHAPLWKAAEEYWRACGGTTRDKWGNNPLSAWRPYFKKASHPSLAGIRTELQRHLRLSAADEH